MNGDGEVVLAVGGAARLLDCSSETVRRYVQSGLLPAVRVRGTKGIRLFKESDVLNLAKKLRGDTSKACE